ncbi:MAG: tRNA pseudouridine(55) synthase TruB [Chlorobi bacterium]|nr:tRNA pseudouridine(55) synthase TruB [Chlorobiota bacterium]
MLRDLPVVKGKISDEDLKRGAFILIDKPLGWTSFDVVSRIRSVLRKRFDRKNIKVGHGGTLDPLATGLLIVAVGPATKKLASIQADDKEYEGIIRLGAVTPSYDLETEPQDFKPVDHLTEEAIRQAMQSMEGEQEQLPPVYSAVRKGGERLYEKARRGEEVKEIKARKIRVFKFEPLRIHPPELEFKAHVSKGTYIRTLAHDLGQKLGCGAYLASLRRTRSGDFHIGDAQSMDEWFQQNS